MNGVGKSTNLAKVAYLLKKEGFSIMLAACDNFRSGAVEQLKTHGRCLEVPVFDRGFSIYFFTLFLNLKNFIVLKLLFMHCVRYKDDPAEIAQVFILKFFFLKKYILILVLYFFTI